MIPASAHYRSADEAGEECETCAWFNNGLCEMFDGTPVNAGWVCDEWSDTIEKDADDPAVAPMYTAMIPPPRGDTPEGMLDLMAAIEPDPIQFLKEDLTPVPVRSIPADASSELHKFWLANPALRNECTRKYGSDPDLDKFSYWKFGLAEPEHADVLRKVVKQGGVFTLDLVKQWEAEELAHARLEKAAGALYLISHAKTRYNRPGQPHDIVHGWKDTPLDSTGRTQARTLGKFLSGVGLDQLHSSDLKRAAQTADVISRSTGTPAKKDQKYRPWNLGDFAGHSSADVIPKLKPYMDDNPDKAVSGGESFNDFTDRFLPALEKLLTQAQQGKTVGLVTHSRNMELAQGWIGGRGPRKKIDTSAISIDKLDPGVIIKFTPKPGGRWSAQEVDDATLAKGQAHPATMNLRVHGVSRHPGGDLMYRMATRDNHYIGITNPTNVRAKKGDVLKVQANDFGRDPIGNFYWVNPNVVSHYTDAAHSHKELQALAGGMLAKDFAAGPAGDPPPAGDSPMGTSQMMSPGTLAATTQAATNEVPVGGSGPTLSSVHRNRPLKNISVAYSQGGGKKRKLKIQVNKADQMKQLVYGIVLEPLTMDSQDDFMLPDQVEKAAHGYLKKVARGRASVSKLQHVTQGFFKNKQGVVPVESYIAPVDFAMGHEMVKKGTWVMVLHIEDPDVWQQVLDGHFTGLSIGGTGIRRSMNPPDDVVPAGYIAGPQASDWFNSNGGVNKAEPADFESWRDYAWEGS